MIYVAGIDGGGTKTRCIICDAQGNIIADVTGGPSNHQIIGSEKTKQSISEAFHHALDSCGLDKRKIHYVHLGLSGADFQSDLDILYSLLDPIFESIPFQIENDTWISMRSGINENWGAVSICGTGSNAGAKHPDGRKYILRAQYYELGNYGGGGDIYKAALHHAFRASEGTGPSTLLEKYLPPLWDENNMDALFFKFFQNKELIEEAVAKVPPLVFKLANKRDKVCQDILIKAGYIAGNMVAGVIRKLGMEDMDVPVVLGGSIYRGIHKGDSPLLIDELTTTLHRTAPRAYIKIPTLPPVAGAFLCALDSLGIVASADVYKKLERLGS